MSPSEGKNQSSKSPIKAESATCAADDLHNCNNSAVFDRPEPMSLSRPVLRSLFARHQSVRTGSVAVPDQPVGANSMKRPHD